MLLAVDVGNTQTVIGVFEDSADTELANRKRGELPGLLHHWRISTVRNRTADEFAIVVDQLLHSAGIALPGAGEPPPSMAPRSRALWCRRRCRP